MRISVLSRSVFAVASLGLASAVLVSAPANAAAPAGVTRAMVLDAADLARHFVLDEARLNNIYAIADKSCNVGDTEELGIDDVEVMPTVANADGFILTADISDESDGTSRGCVFGAVATTDPAFTLTGTASLDVAIEQPPVRGVPVPVTALSGNVFVTAPVTVSSSQSVTSATFSASGNATRSFTVTTSTKVSTPKTKKQKKAAKKKYAKKLDAAKKSYKKALKKAGSSKAKKSAAKRAYAKKKAAAKAAYKKAIATSKIVKTTGTQTENRPFSITTGFDNRS